MSVFSVGVFHQVLLGLPYGGPIDIWSLGCIAVELFLGLPIFPGVSDHNQICRIVEMIGPLPEFMLENGKDTLKFFKRVRRSSEARGVLAILDLEARGVVLVRWSSRVKCELVC